MLKWPGLDINDQAEVKVENGKLVIEPLNKPKYTLDELLSQCPDEIALSNEDKTRLNAPPVGKEFI